MKAIAFTGPAIVVFALTMSATPLQAQQATGAGSAVDASGPPAVQVTPFMAIDSRGSTPVGAAIAFPLTPRFGIETEVEYRRAEGDMNALSSRANLVYRFPRVGGTLPYVTGGAGIAQYGSPLVSRDGSVIGTQPRVALEVNAGGGLLVPIDSTWGIRTDARWFKAFGRNGSEHWRVSNGVSFDVRK